MPKPNAAALQKAAEKVDLTAGPFQVVLETTMGMIRLDLDAKVAPGHVRNMVALAESGFYDGTGFHRIIKGFMIQGGCPEGTGTGGPGYRIPAEFNATPHEPGVLSMARTNDPNSAGGGESRVPGSVAAVSTGSRSSTSSSIWVMRMTIASLPADAGVHGRGRQPDGDVAGGSWRTRFPGAATLRPLAGRTLRLAEPGCPRRRLEHRRFPRTAMVKGAGTAGSPSSHHLVAVRAHPDLV